MMLRFAVEIVQDVSKYRSVGFFSIVPDSLIEGLFLASNPKFRKTLFSFILLEISM